MANSILIKLNQTGRLTETWTVIEMVKRATWTAVISHCSEETAGTSMADLAVATSAGSSRSPRRTGPTGVFMPWKVGKWAMFVRDCMTSHPTTVGPESDPIAARMVLRFCGFRHLPVVDTDGKLVGIMDRADLELFLSKAGSPGIMKRQHRVEQVMIRDVVTVPPDCPLEEAATLMVEHKIGCLPVLEEEQLVGIITETDIFKQFAAVLGGGTDSLRLTLQVADTPGQLAELTSLIAQVNGNISSIVAYPADQPQRVNLTLRVEGAGREKVLGVVSGLAGLELLHVWGGEGR